MIESTLVKQKSIYVDLNCLIVFNFKVRIIIFILSKFDYEHILAKKSCLLYSGNLMLTQTEYCQWCHGRGPSISV